MARRNGSYAAEADLRQWLSRCHRLQLMQMRAAFVDAEVAWFSAYAGTFALGSPSLRHTLPGAVVEVCRNADERWRIDIFEDLGHSCFRDVRCVGDVVYVGYGKQIAVVSPTTGDIATHSLDGYFGHIFSAADIDSSGLGRSVLVSSASELLRFDSAGQLVWRAVGLAIDGVVVHGIQGSSVQGSAEWDPPGGWRPFRLNLESGALL